MHTTKVGIPGVCNEKSTKLWISKINTNKDNNINLENCFCSLIFLNIFLK